MYKNGRNEYEGNHFEWWGKSRLKTQYKKSQSTETFGGATGVKYSTF